MAFDIWSATEQTCCHVKQWCDVLSNSHEPLIATPTVVFRQEHWWFCKTHTTSTFASVSRICCVDLPVYNAHAMQPFLRTSLSKYFQNMTETNLDVSDQIHILPPMSTRMGKSKLGGGVTWGILTYSHQRADLNGIATPVLETGMRILSDLMRVAFKTANLEARSWAVCKNSKLRAHPKKRRLCRNGKKYLRSFESAQLEQPWNLD